MIHRDYPFSRLLKCLALKRDPSRPPLASASFNLDRLDAEPCFDGLATAMDANIHSAVRWELNWNIQADAQGLRVDAHYNRDLFDAARVESWLDDYAAILESLAAPVPTDPSVETTVYVDSVATDTHPEHAHPGLNAVNAHLPGNCATTAQP